MISPWPVDGEPNQVDGKQGCLEVSSEEWFLVVQIVENVLGELRRSDPDDVDDQEDKNS